MRHKFAAFIFTAVLFAAGISTGYGQQQSQRSAADQQRFEALNDAFRNGLLTPQEYDAKFKALNKAVALEDALKNGLLTQQEYSAKLKALGVAEAPLPVHEENGEKGPIDFGPMKTVEVMDPLFNMVAFTIKIPATWNFEGTVVYLPGCDVPTYTIALRAYSPDMLYGVQVTPKMHFYWAENSRAMPEGPGPDCKRLPPMSAVAYGALFSARTRPGSQIDSVESAPDEAAFKASVEQFNPQLAASAAANGNPNPPINHAEIKRLHIHYELNGQPEEELLDVRMALWDSMHLLNSFRPSERRSVLERLHSYESVTSVVGVRAPQGRLQASIPLYRAIQSSMTTNQEQVQKADAYLKQIVDRNIAASWAVHNSIMAQNAQQMAANSANAQNFINNMNEQFAHHEANLASSRAQFDAHQANFANEMASRGAHTQDVCDYLLNQQYFVNPSTGQTTTQDNQYKYTYSDSTGGNSQTFLHTDSATNPNGVVPGYWNALQPIHHQ